MMARIVVADDHELVRNGIKATLERHPHFEVCAVAGNGQETIDKVLELKPDLVILDLSMPVLSGFQAALKIRRAAPAVKILILSIHDAPLVEQISHLVGAHAFLGKSASEQEFITTLNSILDGSPALFQIRERRPPPVVD
jgi:DNA-binding NarL/FixJ family response regulator